MKKLLGICLAMLLMMTAICLFSQPTYAAEIVASGTALGLKVAAHHIHH